MKIRKSKKANVVAEVILESGDLKPNAKFVRIVEENKDDEMYDYGVYVTLDELKKIVEDLDK